MSVEDGLVMQMHCGVMRNHNPALFEKFGSDKGADIPAQHRMDSKSAPIVVSLWERLALPFNYFWYG